MSTFFGLGLQQRFDPSLTNPEPNRTGRHVGQLSTVQPCEKMGVSGMSEKLSRVSGVSDRKLDTLDAAPHGSVRFVSDRVRNVRCGVRKVSGLCVRSVRLVSGMGVRNVRYCLEMCPECPTTAQRARRRMCSLRSQVPLRRLQQGRSRGEQMSHVP